MRSRLVGLSFDGTLLFMATFRVILAEPTSALFNAAQSGMSVTGHSSIYQNKYSIRTQELRPDIIFLTL